MHHVKDTFIFLEARHKFRIYELPSFFLDCTLKYFTEKTNSVIYFF